MLSVNSLSPTRKIHLNYYSLLETLMTLCNMATFENIVLVVYNLAMSLLIKPMSLETSFFIADEDDW